MRCLIFDLDGTLIDSVPDLAAALNRILAADGLAPFSRDEVAAMVGDGAQALIERAYAARARPAPADAASRYIAAYQGAVASHSRPVPGIERLLGMLRESGWTLGVCTNKPTEPAIDLLTELGLAHHFTAICGWDATPTPKPHPAHVLATLAACNGRADRALMIGDHANDVLAASRAGVKVVFASWGYGSPSMAAAADAILPNAADLPGLAERLVPARA